MKCVVIKLVINKAKVPMGFINTEFQYSMAGQVNFDRLNYYQ